MTLTQSPMNVKVYLQGALIGVAHSIVNKKKHL